jgi:hypothetical protein
MLVFYTDPAPAGFFFDDRTSFLKIYLRRLALNILGIHFVCHIRSISF